MRNDLIFLFSFLFFLSCDSQIFDNGSADIYDKKLVMFANLDSSGYMDTCYVSFTSGFSDSSDYADLYISDAEVKIIDNSTDVSYDIPMAYRGRYINPANFISPGTSYTLTVSYDGDTLLASTTTPSSLEFESIDGIYNCGGGENVNVGSINYDNWDQSTDSIKEGSTIDTIDFSMQNCYVGSFASAPYFYLNFEIDDYYAINTVTYALETDKYGLEWGLEDLNQDGDLTDSLEFVDYNSNGVRDSSYTNVIYGDFSLGFDLGLLFTIWKGPYYRDSNYNPLLPNPFAYTVQSSPLPMMWLYFNYYGLQKIDVQATSEDYYNYKAGLTQDNPFLLPNTNVQNGYGLLSSTYTKSFYIYLQNPYDTGKYKF